MMIHCSLCSKLSFQFAAGFAQLNLYRFSVSSNDRSGSSGRDDHGWMDGWIGLSFLSVRTVYDVSPLRLVGVGVQEIELVLRVHDIVPHAAADGDDDDAVVDGDHDAAGADDDGDADDIASGEGDVASGDDDAAGDGDDDTADGDGDDTATGSVDDAAGGDGDDDASSDDAGSNDDHDTAGGDGYDEMVLMMMMQVAMVLS